MQAFSYLGIAFNLLVLPEIIRYYTSIYYSGFIGGFILYVIALQMLKARKLKSKKLDVINDHQKQNIEIKGNVVN